MVDGEKIFKALKLGKVTGLGCTLTSAECDYLIAHDDALTQYIILLENDQLMKQRIAELEARIAELEAQQRWIPISEKLPEKSGYYLTYQEGYIDVKQWWGYWEMMYPITHWMPLPEPPIVYGKVCEE